jgi:uncharacterized protein YutE (UPF0331/DUF86 family)
MDDVVLAKVAVIERCIGRIREEHGGDDVHLTDDLRRQDSIILNLQRACEASIDLAMHLVRRKRLGIPQDSREAFDMLVGAKALDLGLAESLKQMVGFRNVAVHDYTRLNLDIVRSIIARQLADLENFAAECLRRYAEIGEP